jgi:hypothetical protein
VRVDFGEELLYSLRATNQVALMEVILVRLQLVGEKFTRVQEFA